MTQARKRVNESDQLSLIPAKKTKHESQAFEDKEEKNSSNIPKGSLEKKLSRAWQLHCFSFLSEKELRKIAGVSTNFNNLSKEGITQLKKEYKDNIYYTVGTPIQISNPHRRIFFDMDLKMKNRNDIPHKEIFEAFIEDKMVDNLKLFKTEDHALEYSRSLRTGDQLLEGTEVFQPAVYKVIYIGKQPNDDKKQEEQLIINQGYWSPHYDWTERKTEVTYFHAKRYQVLPLEGNLKIHCGNINEYIIHGPIDYNNFTLSYKQPPTAPKEKQPSFCNKYGIFAVAVAIPIIVMGIDTMVKNFDLK
jgi:hypothetical protein